MISHFFLSAILFFIVAVFYSLDFIFMLRFDRERKETGKGWSWDYTLLTIGLGLIVILQPVLFPKIGFQTPALWGLGVQMVGLLMVVASLGLHVWSRQHLQKFYVERIEVQTDHQVIETGPYAWMRHPIITSFFGLAFGILLLAPAITTLFAFAYVLWDFVRDARQEESALMEKLPGYADYMKRVPRFFPRLWK